MSTLYLSHQACLDHATPSGHPERPDRFPWYSYLIQFALREGNTDLALDYVNEGEKTDCEQNEGRRRNDYELRRGQVLSKRGEVDRARDVFERLIERSPSELRYRGTAAESMLSLKQGQSALRFAEGGLAKVNNKQIKVPSLKAEHAVKHTDEQLTKMITNGEEEMPSFKDKLSQQEINLMVRYIRQVVQKKG